MNIVKNEKLLNIFNFDSNSNHNNKDNKEDIINVNNIIQNHISPKYRVIKLFGKMNNAKLYLLQDVQKKQYVCKKINQDNITKEKERQLNFELKLLKYLSSNKSVQKYINPCLSYHINRNHIFTIFPFLDSISLLRFKDHLSKISKKNRIEIVKKLIKNILLAISKVHKLNISHQNINDENILVSINQKEDDINIKFTDFGLGCGFYKIPTKDDYNIKNNNYLIEKCFSNSSNNKFVKRDLDHLKNSKFLQNARKLDDWNLGIIFLDLILNTNEKIIDINLKKYPDYHNNFNINILNPIIDLLNDDKIPNDYIYYLKEILSSICVSNKKRKSSNYLLDNIIFYEKYEE